MSIYTVCNFSACEIIKYSESESESEVSVWLVGESVSECVVSE